MIADRRERAEARGRRRPARPRSCRCPPPTWREIEQRATTTGIVAELEAGGGDLRLRADISESATDAAQRT